MNGGAQRRGVLVLVHRGFSFIEDLVEAIRTRGLEVYILSSRPADAVGASEDGKPRRSARLHELGDWASVTAHDALLSADIEDALVELERSGRQIVGCISVWEGYRRQMAEINQRCGANDIGDDTIALLQDKFAFRRHLAAAGLTSVTSELATEASLARALSGDERHFVKPRHGLASFGAFELKPGLALERLGSIRREMENDADFAAVLAQSSDFVIEKYIEGREYSFEIVVLDGECFLVGVHEKSEVDEIDGATLESAVVSPPISITAEEQARGLAFIGDCLRSCGASAGVYHVEVRHCRAVQEWEIIEINPRIGGSFINASLKAQDPRNCLIALWLDGLLATTSDARATLAAAYRARYADVGKEQGDAASVFFRVYYGEPGKRLKQVRAVPVEPAPALVKVLVPDSTLLPNSSREVFLAQALWVIRPTDDAATLSTIVDNSKLAMRVEYE